MFRSEDIQYFVFLTIVTSRWVLVHDTMCILNISFERQLTKSSNLLKELSKDDNFQ